MPIADGADAAPGGRLAALARELGRSDREWAILAEGNCSLLTVSGDVHVKASGAEMGTATSADFVELPLSELLSLIDDDGAGDDDVRRVFDAAGVDIRYTSFSAEGKAIGGSEQKHDSWDTLEGHARFPRERATRERATVETRLGSFEGWKYVVTETEEGAEGSPAVVRTSSYWFADALPGAPVRMVVEQGGTEVVRMEQVSRKGP